MLLIDSPEYLIEPAPKKKKKKRDKHSEKSATSDLGYVKVFRILCSVYPQYGFRTVSGNQGITVKLVFHVIIPKQFWEWDEESFVSLRFGNSELGSWEKNCGDFHQL